MTGTGARRPAVWGVRRAGTVVYVPALGGSGMDLLWKRLEAGRSREEAFDRFLL
ncbi:hypothetical protein PGT21_022256 [Puccinia graminis f. sp. tritici]|uniref:Uncharacterized protein n=1 Tax=Puccinia graminis f. sp. tritici TaxID=56615 RepID=A0A5B0M1R0_PUCGR|nr:hypothetical protein PGT21_022256 [Puccinia graminis f. sp. tritici]KAA1125747.1 hypothetical protein PGTUg99_013090 [Puccinia graminis f. sp. tritici]